MDEEEKIIDDKYIYTKIQLEDGTVTDAILVAVDAENVKFNDGDNLVDKLLQKASRKFYQDKNIVFDNNTILIDLEEPEEIVLLGTQNMTDSNNTFAIGYDNAVLSTEDFECYGNFIEGKSNHISGSIAAHAEGESNQINESNYSHAEGEKNIIDSVTSHVEGNENTIYGILSHALGQNNTIQDEASSSYAAGYKNEIVGYNSVCLGIGLKNNFNNFLMTGTYNEVFEPEEYQVTENNEKVTKQRVYYKVIGNGTDDENRSNAFILDDSGDYHVLGKLSTPSITGGFYGKFERDKNRKRITSYVYDFGDCKNSLKFFTGGGYQREREYDEWQFQRIEEKFSYWEADEKKYTLNKNEKNYITLVDIHYYNDMKIIQEIKGYKERYDKNGAEVAQFTKETKTTNDGFLLVQLWTEVKKDVDQDDAIAKFDMVLQDKSLDNWIPMYSLTPGHHILEFHCPLQNMELNKIYNVKLKGLCQSGEVTIDINKIKVLVYGEGVGLGTEIPKKEDLPENEEQGGETE